MAEVRYAEATRIYPGMDVPAVDALDLEVVEGEFMVLVGSWGCPYLTVIDNLAFPVRVTGVAKRERYARVREVAEMLELTPFLERKPGQLPGGQRQGVAMGRAIVRRPRVYLGDEPLSNLDAKLRVQMRADIAALRSRLGTTTLYVTHDQSEAMTLGHRVAVLQGRAAAAVRHSARALRPARQHVRGRLHRLALDEPRPAAGRPRRPRSPSAAHRWRWATRRAPRWAATGAVA
jgi:multiple sugar transport system ATP-binding protein